MDLEIEINPEGLEDEYLAGLNRSFGHWGDRSAYRWDFERAVGAPAADLMVLRDEGRVIAGSAVSYRTGRSGADEFLFGVMTGSWTHPEARGRGAFSRMIDESRDLVALHGGTSLIAFVTQENASRRRLVAAGCLEVPSWYVASDGETPPPVEVPIVEPDRAADDELYRAFARWQHAGVGAHVVYPSTGVWASQYLHRPLPVDRLTAAGWHCLVERAPASDRVLWIDGPDPSTVVAALLARAVAAGRQLFFFTLEAALARAAVDLGMAAKPGSVTILDALVAGPGGPVSPTEWRLQGGDRA